MGESGSNMIHPKGRRYDIIDEGFDILLVWIRNKRSYKVGSQVHRV